MKRNQSWGEGWGRDDGGTVGPCVGRGPTLVSIIPKRWTLRQGLGQLERGHLLLLVWPSKIETCRYELSILALGARDTSSPHCSTGSFPRSFLATPFPLSQLSPRSPCPGGLPSPHPSPRHPHKILLDSLLGTISVWNDLTCEFICLGVSRPVYLLS